MMMIHYPESAISDAKRHVSPYPSSHNHGSVENDPILEETRLVGTHFFTSITMFCGETLVGWVKKISHSLTINPQGSTDFVNHHRCPKEMSDLLGGIAKGQ